MKQLERIVLYTLRVVKAATVDIADSLSGDATSDKNTGRIFATVRVFDNESRVAFETWAVDDTNTEIRITLVKSSAKLSNGGQKRTLNYLADSIEQLIENEFL